MTVKIPDSLPWEGSDGLLGYFKEGDPEWTHVATVNRHPTYVRHAVNAYPALVEALRIIAGHTNADDPDSYRSDDREGCLDAVHSCALAALKAAGVEP